MRRILLLLALLAAAPLATGQTVWLSHYFDPGKGAGQGTPNDKDHHRMYWAGASGPNYSSATVRNNNPVTFFAECPLGTKVDYWLYGSQAFVKAKHPSVKCGQVGQSTFTVEYTDEGNYYLGVSLEWITYSVMFAPNGANGGNMSPLTGIVYTNSFNLTANAYTKTGYSFSGWLDPRGVSFGDGYGISGGADFGVVGDGANVVLTAQWTPNTYTATVAPGTGGSGGSTFEYTVSSSSQTKTIEFPTRIGYGIGSWTIVDYGGTKPSVSGTTVTIPANTYGGFTMTPTWTANTYTVTFDANGGTVATSSKTVTYGQVYGDIFPTPTRVGHDPDGWFTEADGGTQVTKTDTVSITADQTLYAHWTAKQCTVNFNPMGGEVSPSSQYVTYGQRYSSLPTPTRAGYVFDGWYTEESGGTKVTADTVYAPASNPGTHYLYARWTGVKYTVTLDAQSGSGGATSVDAEYGSPMPEAAMPTREGYTFGGYWTGVGGTGTQYYEADGSSARSWDSASVQTLYAHWIAREYTVDFNGNGGTSPASISVTYDSTYGNLPTSTRAGHSFAGWWTDAVAGDQIETNTTVSTAADHTLFAHWALLDPVTVHFLSNGGAGDMADTNILCSVSTALPLNTFERTGYTFLHWTNSVGTVYTNGASVTFSDSSTGETVVFGAVWTQNTYTVEFYPNGGKGSMANQAFVYDEPQELSAMTFEFPSPGASFWDFVGWSNVTAGAFYEPGATVSNLTTEANGVVALTAVWASKLSELSQALDCYNLVWTNHVMDAGALGNWTVCSGEGDGSDSCVTNIWSPNLLLATITTNGVLSFSCKCTGTSKKSGSLTILQSKNLDFSSCSVTNIDVEADGIWHRFALYIEWSEGGFLAFRNQASPPSVRLIDQMKWVPEGSEVEPTEEDARDISAISFDGGVLSLSFTNADERFSYNLRGTNTLSVPLSLWPVLWTTNGTGTITITPPSTSISAPPSFFYYLETTSR